MRQTTWEENVKKFFNLIFFERKENIKKFFKLIFFEWINLSKMKDFIEICSFLTVILTGFAATDFFSQKSKLEINNGGLVYAVVRDRVFDYINKKEIPKWLDIENALDSDPSFTGRDFWKLTIKNGRFKTTTVPKYGKAINKFVKWEVPFDQKGKRVQRFGFFLIGDKYKAKFDKLDNNEQKKLMNALANSTVTCSLVNIRNNGDAIAENIKVKLYAPSYFEMQYPPKNSTLLKVDLFGRIEKVNNSIGQVSIGNLKPQETKTFLVYTLGTPISGENIEISSSDKSILNRKKINLMIIIFFIIVFIIIAFDLLQFIFLKRRQNQQES
ncbi:hypothetical protein HPK19_07520 [Arthrobacter citreus]|nr:hypothetical protein HPK19_07520 [Arthrobacter citreus]